MIGALGFSIEPLEVHGPIGVRELKKWLKRWRPTSSGVWSSELILKEVLESRSTQSRGGYLKGGLASILLYREFADVLEVDFLATLSSYRGRGYMRHLLLGVFSESSASELWLEVHGGNASALDFYQKLGMIQEGQRASYYRDGADSLLWTLKKHK